MIVLTNGKDIVDIEARKLGQISEINFFREIQEKFHQEQKFTRDKAYVGEPAIKTPKKKPPIQELTSKEKSQNKELASERILVEHIIRLLKIFRVAQERFRLNSDKYTQIIMTICGLVILGRGTVILS
ncbi:hypothetical protein Tery_1289 [Trichodesmium erythraeum IMS101]|uniref:DDE Tnp4 domain-containing protein n=1 Tax=Trichodesmium erythraeum (strain IMS101) TaxID=203124 RepID=Q116F4_TRIEI